MTTPIVQPRGETPEQNTELLADYDATLDAYLHLNDYYRSDDHHLVAPVKKHLDQLSFEIHRRGLSVSFPQ